MKVDRSLATILLTDIVGSNERAAELGDRAWGKTLGRHHTAIRRELQRFAGREIKNTGDGFLALFDEPGRAIACAARVRDTMREAGANFLRVRSSSDVGLTLRFSGGPRSGPSAATGCYAELMPVFDKHGAHYLVFFLAAAFAWTSLTRNATIFLINLRGIGLLMGNRTEPFAPSYEDNWSLNLSIPDGVG